MLIREMKHAYLLLVFLAFFLVSSAVTIDETEVPTLAPNNTHPMTVSFLYINMCCIFLSLCFWVGFLCAMFWGTDSLPKIAKKHHTVSSYCSCVDDMRLGMSDSQSNDVIVYDKKVRKRRSSTREGSISDEFTGEFSPINSPYNSQKSFKCMIVY
jgi:hypothetical protein